MDAKFRISVRHTRSTLIINSQHDSRIELGRCVYRLDNRRKDSMSIWSMFVKPVSRRQGVASGLIALCKQKAVFDGVVVLWLRVLETNAPARRLYEKSGFAVVEKQDERHKKGNVVYEWRPRESE